jgi:oligosaccharyltransferase complex subunit alpha (ribophorin I)
MDLYPRFPIMGGWQSNFNIGYNLPTKFLVSENNDLYSLNITFGTPFEDIIAKNYTMKVALPEGATKIVV